MKTRTLLAAVTGLGLGFTSASFNSADASEFSPAGEFRGTAELSNQAPEARDRTSGVTPRMLMGEGGRTHRNPGPLFTPRAAEQPAPPATVQVQAWQEPRVRLAPQRPIERPVEAAPAFRPAPGEPAPSARAAAPAESVVSLPASQTGDAATAPWDIHAFNRQSSERDASVVEGIRYPYDPKFD